MEPSKEERSKVEGGEERAKWGKIFCLVYALSSQLDQILITHSIDIYVSIEEKGKERCATVSLGDLDAFILAQSAREALMTARDDDLLRMRNETRRGNERCPFPKRRFACHIFSASRLSAHILFMPRWSRSEHHFHCGPLSWMRSVLPTEKREPWPRKIAKLFAKPRNCIRWTLVQREKAVAGCPSAVSVRKCCWTLYMNRWSREWREKQNHVKMVHRSPIQFAWKKKH